MAHRSIPILCDDPSSACNDCVGCGPAACHTVLGMPCAEPELVGPADLIDRVMTELDQVLSALTEGCMPALDFVHALHLVDGEASLKLGVDPQQGGAALLDASFHALRRLLPDTDIYVSPAAR